MSAEMIKQPFGAIASFAGVQIMFCLQVRTVHFKVGSESDSLVKKSLPLLICNYKTDITC